MGNKEIRVLYAVPKPSSAGGMAMISMMLYDFGLFNNPNISHFDTYYNWGENKFIRALQSVFMKLHFCYILIFKRIDVVYIMTSSYWGFYDKALYCLIARICKVKSVLNPVGGHFIMFHNKNKLNKFLVPIALNIPNAIIAGTSFWFKYFKENFPKVNLIDIPNPVHFKERNDGTKENRKEYVLTYLARVEKDKGIYTFIESAKLLIGEKKKCTFIIAGIGSELENVKEMIHADHHISGFFDIYGFVEEFEKNRIFSITDFYILPTEFEVLPISILEAMSYGNVVVSTNVGGIPDAIIHGETGFLVEPNNHHDIKNLVLMLIENPELKNLVSSNAIKHVKEKYELGVVLESQMKLFNNILDK
jgi:glycosyltransferase involved in cell wall biosynthesis